MVLLLLFLQLINLCLLISVLRNNQFVTDSILEIERDFRRFKRNLSRRKGKC